jgi:hypothetical protein
VRGGGEAAPSVTLSEVLADSPIAYWPLQGDTPLNDYSGNGRHLTASSDPAPTQTGANFPTSGLPMRRFVGDRWDRIAGAAFGIGDGADYSWECCAIVDGDADEVALVGAYDYNNALGWVLTVNPNAPGDAGYVTAGVENGAGDYAYDYEESTPWAGVLTHFAVTFAGATDEVKMYVNGVEVGELDISGTLGAIDAPPFLFVGKNGEAVVPADEDMAHVAVYSTALSAARVLAHYQEVVPD